MLKVFVRKCIGFRLRSNKFIYWTERDLSYWENLLLKLPLTAQQLRERLFWSARFPCNERESSGTQRKVGSNTHTHTHTHVTHNIQYVSVKRLKYSHTHTTLQLRPLYIFIIALRIRSHQPVFNSSKSYSLKRKAFSVWDLIQHFTAARFINPLLFADSVLISFYYRSLHWVWVAIHFINWGSTH